MRDKGAPVVLALDEVQKVRGWPNVVEGLWDADRRNGLLFKVVLSGSSSLLLRKGLEDSLKGRFEVIRWPHWSLAECPEAFGFTLDDFLFFGGFPGAARFAGDEQRWLAYLRDSIIEPTIANDVLEQEDVRKPALMRALFELGAQFSGQELVRMGFYSDLVRDDAGENPSFKDVLLGSTFPPRSEFIKKLLMSPMADSFVFSMGS